MADYSIPVLTKEEIFTYKDIGYLLDERNFDDAEFNEKVAQLNIDAVGYVKGFIIQNYHQYIENSTWRTMISLFVRWQMDSSAYTQVGQELINNYYIQLRDLLQNINENMRLFAENKVSDTKKTSRSNMKIFNKCR